MDFRMLIVSIAVIAASIAQPTFASNNLDAQLRGIGKKPFVAIVNSMTLKKFDTFSLAKLEEVYRSSEPLNIEIQHPGKIIRLRYIPEGNLLRFAFLMGDNGYVNEGHTYQSAVALIADAFSRFDNSNGEVVTHEVNDDYSQRWVWKPSAHIMCQVGIDSAEMYGGDFIYQCATEE